MKRILLVLCLLVASTAYVAAQQLTEKLQQVQNYLDSTARAKVDPHYIEVPEKPWRVILRYKKNAVDVDYSNTYVVPENNAHVDWNLNFCPPVASSIGFWVGYRGTGVSYSKSLTKNAGRYFSVSSTGAKYGFNFRLRRFKTSSTTFDSESYVDGVKIDEQTIQDDMNSPVWIRSVYVNGYYVFNGRRYSQSAAYNQAVIQRRSAGSFLLGATWYQSSFDYSDIENAVFMLFGDQVGRIQVQQANLGVGYGYNFVPFKGFVINAMAMPTLSLYNRVKVYKYDANYEMPHTQAPAEDYGTWNSDTKTWSNGKTHKPLPVTDDSDSYPADFEYWEAGTETEYSWLHLNLDLRLGIAYNWSNYFVGIQGQFNNFHYKKDNSKVNIGDAYVKASLGIRF